MNLTTKELDHIIGRVLPIIGNGCFEDTFYLLIDEFSSKKLDHQDKEGIIDEMCELNLVNAYAKGSYETTKFGRSVVENGGWQKHLRQNGYEAKVKTKKKDTPGTAVEGE